MAYTMLMKIPTFIAYSKKRKPVFTFGHYIRTQRRLHGLRRAYTQTFYRKWKRMTSRYFDDTDF